jgi:leucyl aminopeptidase (aminopeptidase T)
MADNTLLTAVVAATIGLVGTAIGIGGTLLVQLRIEREKQKFEREKLEHERQKELKRKKAEKLEELVIALEEFHYRIHYDLDEKDTDPSNKVEAIQRVYFPEFSDFTKKLGEMYTRYELMKNERLVRAVAKGSGKNLTRDQLDESLKKSYDLVVDAFNAYQDEIERYAKREFQ